ncbi:MAG: Uma2 family endonuclease [Leptolyngbyaceae cyanobacterium RM1_406_9]|nr:Uma2 family endonuclease [Leptolyngbyaceae cyanobacterium RM1_406_9]
MKLEDYETLGIPEYWIVDYLGLGGRRYIGSPKQPTFSVYQLSEMGEYQVKLFRDSHPIESAIFLNYSSVWNRSCLRSVLEKRKPTH